MPQPSAPADRRKGQALSQTQLYQTLPGRIKHGSRQEGLLSPLIKKTINFTSRFSGARIQPISTSFFIGEKKKEKKRLVYFASFTSTYLSFPLAPTDKTMFLHHPMHKHQSSTPKTSTRPFLQAQYLDSDPRRTELSPRCNTCSNRV